MDLNCYILCATGYAEESVRQAGTFLSTQEIQVTWLGLKSGTVSGASGDSLVPTVLLSHLIGDEAKLALPDSLLIAGGAACGQQLLADPRVHRLIQTMGMASKPVGFLYPVSYPLVTLLNEAGVPHPFLLQERRASTDFLHCFGQQLHQLKMMSESKQAPPSI